MHPRQPRKSRQQWRSLIEKFQQCDLTHQQFCEIEKISVGTFRKWRYRLKSQEQSSDSGHQQSVSHKRASDAPGFSQVAISQTAHLPAGVCLELPGNVRVHTQSIPSVEYLKTLVEVLGNGR